MTEYCNQIMSFLDEVEEYNWKNLFSHLIKNFSNDDNPFCRKIFQLYGAMGSSNGLVL